MPRSDDAYDLVHTYDQAKAGKSKTARPAVRELGRDGAPVRLFVQEVRDPALVNTPPAGVRYVFVDQDGDLRRKNPDGSDELAVPTTPPDASYLTVDSEPALTDERELTTSSRVSVTDNGPDSTAEIDVVEDQIEAGNLAGSTGSAGQVLVTDGSDASFGPGPNNTPGWNEDPNSPIDTTGTTSETISLSQTYNLVLVLISRASLSQSADFRLRLNNDTGVAYGSIGVDGTKVVRADAFTLASRGFAGEAALGRLDLTGKLNTGTRLYGRSSLGGRPDAFDGDTAEVLTYTGNTGDLSSLTFFVSSGTMDLTLHVYGITL